MINVEYDPPDGEVPVMVARPDPDILVVGAGPTGLTLAAQAHAMGADVRIVERRSNLHRESRAVVVHPRTLEMLRPLGISRRLVEAGNPNAAFQVHFGDRLTVAGRLSGLGLADTSYPFLLVVSQADTERVLDQHLADIGVTVDRGVELAGLEQDGPRVVCTLENDRGDLEQAFPRFVVGCDGADSMVRRHCGIAFPGSFYPGPLVLADLEVSGELAPETAHVFAAEPGILFFFPLRERGTWRMLAARPRGCEGSETIEELQAIADAYTGGGVRLHSLEWRAEMWLQRRLAERFRQRRVFLAGDAAHLHSPAAAQGMNAGMRDACNLGWKLALVARGVATEALLDSYEAEHRPLARLTRKLTDVAFAGETSDHPLLSFVRTRLAPVALPLGLRSQAAVAALARTVAGFRIGYRGSPAVQSRPVWSRWGVGGGDRLPDAPLVGDPGRTSLHAALAKPAFHLLLAGSPDGLVDARAEVLGRSYGDLVALTRVSRRAGPGLLVDHDGTLFKRLGVGRFAYFVVRPDGYVGVRGDDGALDAARGYLSEWLGPD